jgi:hypothetical protein
MLAKLLIAVFLNGPAPDALEPVGRLEHRAIREASGIIKSRRHPGIFWTHNDSGNPPALFAVRRDGTLVREYALNVPNVDWEDIATDDDGHLYVADIGNNGGRLPLRAIYRLDEPDLSKPVNGPLKINLASHYRFPRDGRFDAEGLFIDRGHAIVVAKTFDGRDAELFQIRLDPPTPLLKPGLPEPVGKLPGFTEPATGADLSADGRRLAVCSTVATRVYERTNGGPWRLAGAVRYPAQHIEAICWDGADLIVASEDRAIFRIAEATWKGGTDRAKGEATKPASEPAKSSRTSNRDG